MTRLPLTLSLALIAAFTLPHHAQAAEEKKKDVKIAPIAVETDKNGNITLAAAKGLAEKQFEMYDQDKNGSFEKKDYMVPFQALAKAKKINLSKGSIDQKAIDESYVRMDTDKDGKISRAEFLADAELRHKMMDANHDGVVTPKEVEDLQKKLKVAHNQAKK